MFYLINNIIFNLKVLLENKNEHLKSSNSHIEKTSESNDNLKASPYKMQIIWSRSMFFASFHLTAICYFYFIFTLQTRFITILFQVILAYVATIGVSAGAHRLWSHKTYKARWPLSLTLALLQTMALQMPIAYWVRIHRLHHKYLDTDADPINSKRGLFFSHIGWFLVEEHPEVIEKTKTIDLSDMERDPLIVYQEKLIVPLAVVFCIALPTWIPMYFWGETFLAAWCSMSFKCAIAWNLMFTINSLSHSIGTKPYDCSITPTNNSIINWLVIGEGWHNYHHVFPWDYKSADERGDSYNYNPMARLIEFCAWLGLAYDLKTPSEQLKRSRTIRTGDGHRNSEIREWGWGDKDMGTVDGNMIETFKVNKNC